MPPARSKAKAKAKAVAEAVARKNARRDCRRAAATALNDLARECHVPEGGLLQDRDPSSQDVEAIVRLLQRRIQTDSQLDRLRAAAEQFLANGGVFEAPLLQDEAGPPAVRMHRVLEPTFLLQSKAFMLTYNSSEITRSSWQPFRNFMASLQRQLGARGWAACLEVSTKAASGQGERLHAHGLQLECIATLMYSVIGPTFVE